MCYGLNILMLKGKGNYNLEYVICLNQCYPIKISKMMEMFYIVLFNMVPISNIQLPST